jgi:hypothetical protein
MSSQQKENAKGSSTEGVITHRNLTQAGDDVYKARIGCSNLALKSKAPCDSYSNASDCTVVAYNHHDNLQSSTGPGSIYMTATVQVIHPLRDGK